MSEESSALAQDLTILAEQLRARANDSVQASRTLLQMAEELKETVEKFKTDETPDAKVWNIKSAASKPSGRNMYRTVAS
ncbi:MAG: hypothetical protein Q7O66_05140 [Dehalococcoidia bacterium]|nr:hypothetical protein [Dehalococcoidia bacterium]